MDSCDKVLLFSQQNLACHCSRKPYLPTGAKTRNQIFVFPYLGIEKKVTPFIRGHLMCSYSTEMSLTQHSAAEGEGVRNLKRGESELWACTVIRLN